MKRIRIIVMTLIVIFGLAACHHEKGYTNTQSRFVYDNSFRLGKWYSITDSGTTSQTHNTSLDTIWFINDTLAGWTGFGGNPYSYFKTYIDPKSIYNLVYLVPDPNDYTRFDTAIHQFGFTPTGDTLTIYWSFSTSPPQAEEYLKMK